MWNRRVILDSGDQQPGGAEPGDGGFPARAGAFHPYLGLVASGGKDGVVKMWDPKSGHCATTLHGHKNSITCSKWNKNGNWLVTGSKDQTLKVWDLRMLKEIGTYRGHGKDVTEVIWHPTHEAMFTSGSFDGSINYWLVGAGEAGRYRGMASS